MKFVKYIQNLLYPLLSSFFLTAIFKIILLFILFLFPAFLTKIIQQFHFTSITFLPIILNVFLFRDLAFSSITNFKWLHSTQKIIPPKYKINVIWSILKQDNIFEKLKSKENLSYQSKISISVSYNILMICIFANTYYMLSSFCGLKNFNLELSIIDSIYFSTITAMTIGYGDILPISQLAKIIVTFQVFISLYFALIILSNITEFHKNINN